MDFTNKVVLVTGASTGIGRATALLFAKLGAELALVAIPGDERDLSEVAEQCAREHGLVPLQLAADLATDEGCERTAKCTLQHFGKLDILINNAGIGCRTGIQNGDMESFDRVFGVNVRGLYNLTRLLVPALIAAKGNIVNVSSISATTVTTGNVPYSMTKAAVSHFTRIIALELAPKGVRVNAVCPGLTVTKFVQRLTDMSEEQYAAWVKQTERLVPLGRACAGDDIARMIAHLASDSCALVTGALVPVDGGITLVGAGISSAFKT